MAHAYVIWTSLESQLDWNLIHILEIDDDFYYFFHTLSNAKSYKKWFSTCHLQRSRNADTGNRQRFPITFGDGCIIYYIKFLSVLYKRKVKTEINSFLSFYCILEGTSAAFYFLFIISWKIGRNIQYRNSGTLSDFWVLEKVNLRFPRSHVVLRSPTTMPRNQESFVGVSIITFFSKQFLHDATEKAVCLTVTASDIYFTLTKIVFFISIEPTRGNVCSFFFTEYSTLSKLIYPCGRNFEGKNSFCRQWLKIN